MFNPRVSRLALLVGLAVTAAFAHPARGETLLRWKLEKGHKSRFVMAQEMQMTMVVRENPILITSSSTMEADWEVTEVDDQGVATMTQTVDRIRMKLQGAQGVMMEYDSESDEKPEGMAAMMIPMLEAMVGKPCATKLDAQGNVLEMELPQGLAESVTQIPGRAGLGDMFSEEGMKRMAEIAVFPKEPVNPGDTWSRVATIENPVTGDMTVASAFRYVGKETVDGRELEKIAMEITMSVGEGGTATVSISDQSSEGLTYFDNVLGRFVRGEATSKMTMQISILGQEMKQEIESTTTTECTPQP